MSRWDAKNVIRNIKSRHFFLAWWINFNKSKQAIYKFEFEFIKSEPEILIRWLESYYNMQRFTKYIKCEYKLVVINITFYI